MQDGDWIPAHLLPQPEHEPLMSKRTGDTFAAIVVLVAVIAGCVAAIQ